MEEFKIGSSFAAGIIVGALCALQLGCEAEEFEGMDGEDMVAVDWQAPTLQGDKGEASDDVPGCAVIRGLQMNPAAGDADSRRWVAVDTSGCGPEPAPRLVRFEVGNGLEIEVWAESDGGCAIAIDEEFPGLVFDDELTITVWSGGGSDDALNTAEALHDGDTAVGYDNALTWFRVTDALFVPMLPWSPTCEPPPWL